MTLCWSDIFQYKIFSFLYMIGILSSMSIKSADRNIYIAWANFLDCKRKSFSSLCQHWRYVVKYFKQRLNTNVVSHCCKATIKYDWPSISYFAAKVNPHLSLPHRNDPKMLAHLVFFFYISYFYDHFFFYYKKEKELLYELFELLVFSCLSVSLLYYVHTCFIHLY